MRARVPPHCCVALPGHAVVHAVLGPRALALSTAWPAAGAASGRGVLTSPKRHTVLVEQVQHEGTCCWCGTIVCQHDSLAAAAVRKLACHYFVGFPKDRVLFLLKLSMKQRNRVQLKRTCPALTASLHTKDKVLLTVGNTATQVHAHAVVGNPQQSEAPCGGVIPAQHSTPWWQGSNKSALSGARCRLPRTSTTWLIIMHMQTYCQSYCSIDNEADYSSTAAASW